MNQDLSELLRAATDALNRGEMQTLHNLSQQILAQDKNQADAWFFLSIAEAARSQIKNSLLAISNALTLKPDHTEYLIHKARLHTMQNDRAPALEAANKAAAQNPTRALLLDTLGVVYSRFEAHEKAAQLLRKTVELEPKNPQFQFNLGSVEQFLGNADAARLAYENAVALAPDFARAHWALSELEKNAVDDARLAVLLTQISRPNLGAEDELYLGHAIARAYENQQQYELAFEYLNRGKARQKVKVGYQLSQDFQLFNTMQSAFSKEERQPQEDANARQIFIVGMPRSGTTLVDRILDSHSMVQSLGERQDFARLVKQASNTPSNVVLDESVIKMANQLDLIGIGKQYQQQTAVQAATQGSPGYWTTDKMPLNFLYIGLILQSMPAAKIVCLKRNPVDTCLSNYRQLFAVNFSYYNYHYDIQDTAHYYGLFSGLMDHWKSLYGGRIHELSYESLTAHPEPTIRALLDYIGLSFEAKCLDFHQNTSAVSTASAMQVREPLYQNAVGRWHHYKDQLAGVLSYFDEQDIRY
ncbi:MAG: tetratricopeptide (TPR) repeat protein [Candidatus Azotimanducaceae bacterium]|jgi:tetratricopeptide (TPR) repeat protein